MFSWILITITAHFLNAIVSIIDKHIVSNTVLRPVAYTFYSGVFQILFIALVPIVGFTIPETGFFILGISNGALFILALLIFYKALKLGEASRVIPVVGATVPIFTVLLSYLIMGELLTTKQFFAFAFFVLGGFLLSSKLDNGRFSMIKGFLPAAIAGLLFALYYTLIKYLYLHISFFDGFILFQIGGFFGAVLLLLSKQNRKKIFSTPETIKKRTAYLFIPNKILAAVAAILIFYAISIEDSSVAIINSLQSVQYVFVLLFAIILSKKLPKLYHEQARGNVIMQKVGAIVLIGIGLVLLGG
ncbi:MAG: DMT family transporter [Candidatus Pacebacteria bacterium]|nr:DMT family transporter [Candidatus Paceibacterota bacterium]